MKKQIYTQDFSGGLVINKLPHKLKENQSPKMLNMLPFDENGIMMRTGQKYIQESPSDGMIYNVHQYEGFVIFAGKTGTATYKLYYTDLSASTVTYTEFYTLTGSGRGTFFEFDGALFFLNGTEYVKITISASVPTAATVTGYVPLAYINCAADGTGYSAVEGFNLLTNKYRIRYIPDGTVKAFVLPHTVLTANLTQIKAYSLYPTRTEITGFTSATAADGKTTITFTTAPAAFAYYMGGNTLEIVAPDDSFAADTVKVTGCAIAEEFGGSLGGLTSGTRVFITGNPTYPGSLFWSGVASADYNAAEYFPDVNVEIIGDGAKPITALGKMQNELIAFKERSVHGVTYSFNGTTAAFSVRELNGYIGCDMPYTVKLVNNDLCFSNTYGGVHLLVSTSNQDERNVVPISANINTASVISDVVKGLLGHSSADLKAAVAYDDGRRYWLCVRPMVYVWDYGNKAYTNYSDIDAAQNRLSWWLLDNFNAACFMRLDGRDVYGSANKLDFVVPSSDYKDFGQKITAFYKTRGYDAGDPTVWKHFKQIIFSQKTATRGQAVFRYTADKVDFDGEKTRTQTFSFDDFAFDTFTFETVNYGDIHSIYPQMEHTAYFSWTVSNGDAGTDLFITDVKTILFLQRGDY